MVSGGEHQLQVANEHTALYARGGAVIPLAYEPRDHRIDMACSSALLLATRPGRRGRLRLR